MARVEMESPRVRRWGSDGERGQLQGRLWGKRCLELQQMMCRMREGAASTMIDFGLGRHQIKWGKEGKNKVVSGLFGFFIFLRTNRDFFPLYFTV